MKYTHSFRFIKGASWGIAIDLAVCIDHLDKDLCMMVADGVGLVVVPYLEHGELAALMKGVEVVADSIPKDIMITVTDVHYNPTDYQKVGLTCAIAELLGKIYGFESPLRL